MTHSIPNSPALPNTPQVLVIAPTGSSVPNSPVGAISSALLDREHAGSVTEIRSRAGVSRHA